MHSQMRDLLNTPVFDDELSDGDNSKDGLEIVLTESPNNKSKDEKQQFEDQLVIEQFEDQIEMQLDEKAAKTNLTTRNVKNMLRHVLTNEHVVTMVRQTIEETANDTCIYEPKLTRAKAKELFPSQPMSSWLSPGSPSEHHVLINKELSEDSSGDEYIPGEEESEDDQSNVTSDVDSQPRTPAKPNAVKCNATDSSTQTVWTNDGLFKIPTTTIKSKVVEDAEMIALRTRSKLSLNDTPLEIIEGAFVPPDVTTDMYDLECDDEDWKEFLKKFTRPLDEAVTGGEDEEMDPEYNVLADEGIDKVDKEELRADRGVKVTRKELNTLINELFEFTNTYTNNYKENAAAQEVEFINTNHAVNDTAGGNETVDPLYMECENPSTSINQMDTGQLLLLEQQLRQHVQMLTQNYLLMFEHPELWDMASNVKENLLLLYFLSKEKHPSSYFNIHNLKEAVALIGEWESLKDTEEFVKAQEYVMRVITESKEARAAGNEYVFTFSPLFMKTVAYSKVFLYPSLLPKIPFKCTKIKLNNHYESSENELIAIGLEQFTEHMENEPRYLTPLKTVRRKDVAGMLCKYLIPTRTPSQLHNHIRRLKDPKCADNPIKYFFENKYAPPTTHYVVKMEELGDLPPAERPPNSLPLFWKQFLGIVEEPVMCQVPVFINQFNKITKPPAYNKNVLSKRNRSHSPKGAGSVQKRTKYLFTDKQVRRFSKPTDCSITLSPKCISSSARKLEEYFLNPASPSIKPTIPTSNLTYLKFNSSLFSVLKENSAMLPSMPYLSTPFKEPVDMTVASEPANTLYDNTANETSLLRLQSPNVAEQHEEELNSPALKDNEDELNALMVASSTIKTGKRPASSTERKKSKLKREYSTNLNMLSPENAEVMTQKEESYAQAFFDKLQEQLEPVHYQNVLIKLNEFDSNVHKASDLYKNIEAIIGEHYPDICEEFLSFLTPSQASEIGKLAPYLKLQNMSKFLKKLEIFYASQPAQLKKIYNALNTFSVKSENNMEEIKTIILPLLKGSRLLMDWFLQIFPSEKPPQSLFNGAWEQINFNRSEDTEIYSGYEHITMPEVEDPYGGTNCICSCHQVPDEMFKTRARHCVPCGTKFLQGRVYVQTGKGLRLANITFNNTLSLEQIARLSVKKICRQKRRSETVSSPSKQHSSPTKDGQEEPRLSNESDDDQENGKKIAKKVTKTPRKKKAIKPESSATKKNKGPSKLKVKAAAAVANTNGSELKEEKEPPQPTVPDEPQSVDTVVLPIPDAVVESKQLEEPVESVMEADNLEWECNTSIESVDLKSSPVADTESVGDEFLEESSQDNIATESDGSISDLETEVSDQEHSEDSDNDEVELDVSWTMEEDKIILQTIREEGNNSLAFEKMQTSLRLRSVTQLKQRFQVLMSLLQKMARDS